MYRKMYKQARREKDSLLLQMMAAETPYSVGYWFALGFRRLMLAEYLETDHTESLFHALYRRIRNHQSGIISTVMRRIRLDIIRFASRANGNIWDDSLKMVATPPTSSSADEYSHVYIRQQGGAVCDISPA